MIVIQLNQEAEKMEGTGRGKLFKSSANEILELRQRIEELEAEMEIHKHHTELVGSLTHYMVKRGIGTPGQCSTTEIVRVYEDLEAQQSEVAARAVENAADIIKLTRYHCGGYELTERKVREYANQLRKGEGDE